MDVLKAPLTENLWLAQLSDGEPPAIQLSCINDMALKGLSVF